MHVTQVDHLAKLESHTPRFQQQDLAQLRADAEQYSTWLPQERLSWLAHAEQVVERHIWWALLMLP